jgi:hypothetical protein
MAKTKIHTRYKTIDGEVVPGVTTVLGELAKPALIHWAWDLGTKGIDYRLYRDDKAEIGTLAHYLIMCHLKGETPDTSDYSKNQIDQAENCILSYFEWEKDHPFVGILIEQPLVSEVMRFGGTPDLLCVMNGDRVLVDFKTGKAIYPDFFFQLAAYKALIQEKGYVVDKARILRIGRDETESFEDRQAGDLETEWDIFIHALSIYQAKKQLKEGRDGRKRRARKG